MTGERGRERTYRGRGLVIGIVVPFKAGAPAWVDEVRTSDRRYRTRSGVGVGSSGDQVRSLGRVDCYDGRCQIGLYPATLFQLSDDRVSGVLVVSGAD
jgi:hypothetical protein